MASLPNRSLRSSKHFKSQRIQLTIDLAGLDARREVLARAQAKMENDNMDSGLAPLRELLMLEKKSLDRKRELAEKAVASNADVLAAQKEGPCCRSSNC